MKNKKIILMILSWLLVGINLFLIFNFSSQDASQSSQTVNTVIVNTIGEDNLEKLADKYTMETVILFIRKIGHFLEFMSLGFFFCIAYFNTFKNEKKITWLFAFGSGVLCASIDEISQSFSPGRVPMVKDVLIDGLGIFSGVSIAILLLHLSFLIFNHYHKGKKI